MMLRPICVWLGAMVFMCLVTATRGEPQDVSAALDGKQVVVQVAGQVFTVYRFDPTLKKPYFFPINGPLTGTGITTANTEPYPHHHSLFFGCDRVNGGNYWQEANARGQIVSEGARIIEARGRQVVIEDRCRWQRPGAPEPFADERRIVISAPDARLRLIDFSIRLVAQMDVHIEKTNHSLFSGRIATHMCAEKGGRLVNAEGNVGEKATYGKKSAWCDYSGDNRGKVEGMAILDWPKNPWSPSPWFTRDYGFFSCTPMYWMEADGMRFKKGESVQLKYRVVVHAGNEKDADIKGLYATWIGEGK